MSIKECRLKAKEPMIFCCLPQLLDGSIRLLFSAGNLTLDYCKEIRREGSMVSTFAHYNLREEEGCLFLRATMRNLPLKIAVSTLSDEAFDIWIQGPAGRIHIPLKQSLYEIQLVPQPDGSYLGRFLYGVDEKRSEGSRDSAPWIRKPEDLALQEEIPIKEADDSAREPIDVPMETKDSKAPQSFDGERFASSSEARALEEECARLEKQKENELTLLEELREKRNSLLQGLEELKEEYEKDYTALQLEEQEMVERLHLDRDLLSFYREDKKYLPAEQLLQQAETLLDRAEKTIAQFVRARQEETDGIRRKLER